MGHPSTPQATDYCIDRCTFLGVAPKVIITIREPYSFYRSRYTYHKGELQGRGIRTFEQFMFADPSTVPRKQQSWDIRDACGTPCKYDYVLHTETLAQDWYALLEELGLPRIGLPHVIPSGKREPPTLFTPAIAHKIEQIDRPMFEEFGYLKREAPFTIG